MHASENGPARPEAETYGEMVRLEELLSTVVTDEADLERAIFLATHQSCELWFAVILRNLEEVRDSLLAGRVDLAAWLLSRVPRMFKLLEEHFEVLSEQGEEQFLGIRPGLGTASGFQSSQWREVEALCTGRGAEVLETAGFTPEGRERLRRRLEEPSILDALERAFGDGPAPSGVLNQLARVDEAVMLWKARHAVLAERYLRSATGTGGSSGATYLWEVARRPLIGPLPASS